MVQLKGLGDKIVTTAGTRVQLSATSILTTSVVITALETNTGLIYIGGNDVSSALAGMKLGAGDVVEITGPNIRGIEEELDVRDIYIDAAVNGEGVTVACLVRRD